MVYKGDVEREKEIIRFVIKNRALLKEYLQFLPTLHIEAYREVLGNMNIENLRELDLDWEAIDELLSNMVRTVGTERAIETIGLDKIIQTAGREKIIQELYPKATSEQIKKALAELDGYNSD